MRDLRRCDDNPFGGATAVLFSGDFRQVGPVVLLFGKRADVVEASLIYSHLFVETCTYSTMRTPKLCELSAIPDTSLDCYSTTVHAYRFHRPGNDIDTRRVHATRSQPVPASLIDFVYHDIMTAEPTEFANRGILSPTNVSGTDEINENTCICNILPADRQIHLSSSNNLMKTNPTDIAEVTSPEFLQTVRM
ncbi:unnamed protein product [Scytosiphon promiscuus]